LKVYDFKTKIFAETIIAVYWSPSDTSERGRAFHAP
jgi:hypothetical protein